MNKNTRINSIALALLLIATAVFNLGVAQSQEGKIVPYVPTPQEVVDRMLELAQVKKGDVVYDLGSGDGRIVVAAAKKYGVRAIGFEIDPERIKESTENINKAGVGQIGRASGREGDKVTAHERVLDKRRNNHVDE